MRAMLRSAALCGASCFAMVDPEIAIAQASEEVAKEAKTEDDDDDLKDAREIVVLGHIGYRNRTETTEPTLVYDTEYFQRFEPLTAGDALKRVPSVSFLSDVIESDGARLRGLDPGYTQILVNGEKVPGSNVDRSFFLDRIPAELIDRVEIVRSNSARRTADAVAGTLNIVLRDAFELDGGYVKAGGLLFDDGDVKPSLGAVWGGALGPGRLLIGGTIQGRHNPKDKLSLRYGDSPENDPDFETEEFDNREDQSDTRDGTDYSLNGSYGIDFGATKLEFNAFYVHTDRDEHERSREYDDRTATTGPIGGGGNLLTDNDQAEDIKQDNYSLDAKARHEWSLGETTFRIGYSRFSEDIETTEVEVDFDTDEDPPEFGGERQLQDIEDREFSLGFDHKFGLGSNVNLIVGAFYQDKDRDTDISSSEDEFELPIELQLTYDQFEQSPVDFPTAFDEFEPITGGLNRIEERRKDAFALVEGKTGIASWEAGVRLETTDVGIDDFEAEESFSNDYSLVLPSAALKLDVTASDRINLAVARTNRRPRFDYLSPALLEAELGDNDLLGNPALEPETAWGVDAGFEHRIGRTGVVGVNLFYRKVSNLVETVTVIDPETGDPLEGSEGEGTFVLQPQNAGSGKTWGIEFDLSTSLEFVGLPDTGIFGNLALLDSKVHDDFGSRRFNGQPKYVYNLGFIQDLRNLAAAFGVTYRKQGPARDRVVGEEVKTTYGGELEAFIEKRFGKSFTLRAVGQNLLNGKKKEVFNKFDTIEDQFDRDFDEYEIESEKAGPIFQLVGRLAF
ncbi:MAG TPA: TonB-dependent receptor [Sphingomicrobium sp.]|nr:TonB-dependent receptor [Sphingomicrobium sp.]